MSRPRPAGDDLPLENYIGFARQDVPVTETQGDGKFYLSLRPGEVVTAVRRLRHPITPERDSPDFAALPLEDVGYWRRHYRRYGYPQPYGYYPPAYGYYAPAPAYRPAYGYVPLYPNGGYPPPDGEYGAYPPANGDEGDYPPENGY